MEKDVEKKTVRVSRVSNDSTMQPKGPDGQQSVGLFSKTVCDLTFIDCKLSKKTSSLMVY